MVKRNVPATSRKKAIATAALPLQLDSAHLSAHRLAAGTMLHRIHRREYGPAEFNSSQSGNARFSPITTPAGKAIPTIYAGENFQCAAMETVFHDVPMVPGLKTIDQARLSGLLHSVIETCEELQLADLRTVPLRKLGLQRRDLIDTEKNQYPQTRAVAATIHASRTEMQGLLWTSRQDDSSAAVMLFGDRITGTALAPAGSVRDLLTDPQAFEELIALGDRLGVLIVAG
jgi:RES domain